MFVNFVKECNTIQFTETNCTSGNEGIGVRTMLVRLTKMSLEKIKVIVKMNGEILKPFNVGIGLKQSINEKRRTNLEIIRKGQRDLEETN